MARNFVSRLFGAVKKPENYPEREVKEIKTIKVQNVPLGSSGTEVYSGYIQEEYLDNLRDDERADIFDKMRRQDPQVKMCLSAVKNPIKSASVGIEIDSDEPAFQKHVDLVSHCLFQEMKTPWSKFLREALTVIEFGYAPFEITHKNFMESEIGPHTGLCDLSWRSPRTIERFNMNYDGTLHSISQYAYGDLQRLVSIESDFLLMFGLDVEGSNYEGISMLRPCYGNWFRKQQYLKLNAIGIEKFAVPTPIASVPEGKEGTVEFTELEMALERYANHENNYLIKPKGWDLELSKNTYDPQKVEISIDNEDKRMVKAFLANFLELGMGTTGSYALSNDLSDFFLSGIQYVAGHIEEIINQKVIKPLIIMNFGAQPVYPKIKFSGINDKAGEELANILTKLADKKILTPDDKLEKEMRQRYKLPPMSDIGQRKLETQQSIFGLSEKIREKIRLSDAR